MKAVVLEIKDGYAAVLSEDGQFRKIKDDGYLPGMELTLEKTKQKEKKDFGKLIDFRSRRLWSGVATVAAALLIFIGVKDFNTPYGTISLDVNPSIEISINRYDRVLSIDAVNDDATEIVDELNSSGLKYKSVDDAVDMALDSFSEGDYSAEDGTTYVMISANSENDKHSDKIVNELDSVCSEHDDISAQTITADEDLVKRAREHGTTAGKQYLVDSLKEVSGEEDFDESDWLKKPVKDIMREIDDKKEPVQDNPGEAPQDSADEIPQSEQAQPKPKDEPETIDENKPDSNQPVPQDDKQGDIPDKENQAQPEPKDRPEGERDPRANDEQKPQDQEFPIGDKQAPPNPTGDNNIPELTNQSN